jgi:hypothetical protein
MPIKVYLDDHGKPYAEAESAAEAVELMKLWGGVSKNGIGATAQTRLFDEPSAMNKLLMELQERPKKLLKALVDFPQGTDGDKVSEVSGEPTTAFGGLLGSVSKQATKLNLKPQHIFISEMRGSGTKRIRFMQPGKLLMKYSEQLKTPKWKMDMARLTDNES